MIQKIQLIQKETQQMNGELATSFGLAIVSNDSESQSRNDANNDIVHVNANVRPTELIPVHTLVTDMGGQTAVTTTASTDIVNKQLTPTMSSNCSYQVNHILKQSNTQNASRQTAI